MTRPADRQTQIGGGVRVILGIDPGLRHTGWGCVRLEGDGTLGYLACGVITTQAEDSVATRLLTIHQGLAKVLGDLTKAPTKGDTLEVAVEETFVNVNAKSSLVLGMARGVALLAVAQSGQKPISYAPNAIKSAVAGNGHASKEQVAAMVRLLLPELLVEENGTQETNKKTPSKKTGKRGKSEKVLPLRPPTHRYDALDALAVAICHAHAQSLAQAIEVAGVRQ